MKHDEYPLLTAIFSRTPDWRLEEEGDEVVLHHASKPQVVALSPTAALICDLCDGIRSVEDLESELCRLFPDDAESISGDLLTALARLQRAAVLRLAD